MDKAWRWLRVGFFSALVIAPLFVGLGLIAYALHLGWLAVFIAAVGVGCIYVAVGCAYVATRIEENLDPMQGPVGRRWLRTDGR